MTVRVYTAPACRPDGTDLYVVYNAFTTPYRNDTTAPVAWWAWCSTPTSRPAPPAVRRRCTVARSVIRAGRSQNGLTAEFLGDYVYAAATRRRRGRVWNDASNAADCPAIDAYRASLYTSTPVAPPNVLASCPAAFGNSDIRGGAYADPTP